MWLAILILAPFVIVLHGHYISRQIESAATELFPRAERPARWVRRGYLALTYSVPVLLVGWVLYVVVVRPDEARPPVNAVLDYGVLVPFWLATIYGAQCTVLVGPVHLVMWGLGRLGAIDAHRWRRHRRGFVLVVATVFLVYLPARVIIDRTSMEVRTHEVALAGLPAALDGYRIALIADPQADQYTGPERLAQLVETTNAQQPDLVLIAGDIITGAPRYIGAAAEVLGRLRAPDGVVSAIGDHENFAYRDRARSVREIRDALAGRGVAMLDNDIHRVEVGDAELAVVVATDNYITRIPPEAARALLARAADAEARVLVAHQTGKPLLHAARDAGVQLYLSGHTHGGQVRLWLPGFDFVAARIESPYVTGRYRGGELGPMELIVSSGLGVSVIPFRYSAPATVDVITLRAAE